MTDIFNKFFILKNQEYNLDICRILFYTTILFWIFTYPPLFSFPGISDLYDPGFLHKFLHLPHPGSWIYWLRNLWLVSIALSAVGFFTPISMATAFLLGFYIYGVRWYLGTMVHLHHIIVIASGIMAFSGAGKYFSLDSLVGRYFPKYPLAPKITSENNTWAIRMVQLSICLMYFNGSLSKIRRAGLDFISSENFQNILISRKNHVLPRYEELGSYLLNYPQYGSMLMMLAFTLEFLSPLAFFLKGWPRWLILTGLVGLHVGSHMLLGVNFIIFTAVYFFWIPWTSILRRFGRNSRIPGNIS